MDPVNALFDRMDSWRHLPNYQLERRADLLFSLYLPEVLEDYLGFAIQPTLIPEFPVRRAMVSSEVTDHTSFKIDYLALSADGRRAVFVELKTDGRSRRTKQDEYLLRAKKKGLPKLLRGLLQLFQATSSKRKYFCMLEQLAALNLVEIPESARRIVARGKLQGISRASEGIQVTCQSKEHHIVYVQPRGTESNVISFDAFRRVVARHRDPVSIRFAQSLAEWRT